MTVVLKPGDKHPKYRNWCVEKVHHSPTHVSMFKFQWVRRDGVRGTRMGWLGLFDSKQPEYDPDTGYSNIGADFDIKCLDKNEPLGPDDLTLRTVRWYSWDAAAGWPPPPESEPVKWDSL